MHGYKEQTDRSQRGGEWGRLEEISQRTYNHIRIAHGHGQQCCEGHGVRVCSGEGKGWGGGHL